MTAKPFLCCLVLLTGCDANWIVGNDADTLALQSHLITITAPDSTTGKASILADPAASPANTLITVTNTTQDVAQEITSEADGAFATELAAELGDEITISSDSSAPVSKTVTANSIKFPSDILAVFDVFYYEELDRVLVLARNEDGEVVLLIFDAADFTTAPTVSDLSIISPPTSLAVTDDFVFVSVPDDDVVYRFAHAGDLDLSADAIELALVLPGSILFRAATDTLYVAGSASTDTPFIRSFTATPILADLPLGDFALDQTSTAAFTIVDADDLIIAAINLSDGSTFLAGTDIDSATNLGFQRLNTNIGQVIWLAHPSTAQNVIALVGSSTAFDNTLVHFMTYQADADEVSFASLDAVEVGDAPQAMAALDVGGHSMLVVCNNLDNSLVAIDLTSTPFNITKTSTTGLGPIRLVAHDAEDEVYVLNQRSLSLTVHEIE